jgi:hypothetical protein
MFIASESEIQIKRLKIYQRLKGYAKYLSVTNSAKNLTK